MRQPQTIWSLCAFIFGLMGIIFVFLGMLFYITDIPVNGGCNWSFIPIGAILLLGSIVCLARCGLQEQRSLLSWIKPATDFQQPVIYLDPRNPVHAYVDMDTIKWELSSF